MAFFTTSTKQGLSPFVSHVFWKTLSLTAAISSSSFLFAAQPAAEKTAKTSKKQDKQPINVLFLISDDMRADLHVYGNPVVHTPNLDKLASQGVRFERAYCQYPLSGPSRASILSGRYPTTSGLYGNREWFGASHPDWVSLPKYFKQNGYASLRTGKVFHGGIDDTEAWTEGGEARRVSNPINTAPPSYVSLEEHLAHVASMTIADKNQAAHSDRWEAVEGEEALNQNDTKVADKAIEYIKRSKEMKQPFFIACGLSKPHSPLIAPKEFFDLYKSEDIILPPDFASLPMVPRGFPAGAIRQNTADLFVSRSASPEDARDMIKAYLACISYVDWNIGRVIAALDEQGLRENTIIVFWSDHGYQLGEKGKWSKAGSLWEQGTRIPFLILDPRENSEGQTSPRTVQLVDIYPTLADLCGLPIPEGLDGKSLAPLVKNPLDEWDRPAYTVWNEHGKGVTGVSVRTEKYHYAEFFGVGAGAFLTIPEEDPDELTNLVYDAAYKDVVAQMHELAMKHVEGQAELSAPAE